MKAPSVRRRAGRVLPRGLLLCLLAWLAAPVLAADGDAASEVRELLAEEGLQAELPSVEERPADRERPGTPLGRGLSRLTLWLVGAALVVAAVIVLLRVRQAPGQDLALPDPPDAAEEPPGSGPGRARALAAEGRLDEALGALLEETLSALGAAPLPLGRTSRERAAGLSLEDGRRVALRELLVSSEAVLFGPAAADTRTWQRALELSDQLQGEAGGSPS